MTRYSLLLPLVLLISSCNSVYNEPPVEEPPATIEGYAPVYDASGAPKLIKADTPRNIVNGGKIYLKGNTLFQVETGKGIHVISISDAANPVKLKFLRVPGCQELSIKDNYLYTNNLNDLVVIDITDFNNPRVAERIANTFHITAGTVPPTRGWFECPEDDKGIVIGWELKTLHYPNCRY